MATLLNKSGSSRTPPDDDLYSAVSGEAEDDEIEDSDEAPINVMSTVPTFMIKQTMHTE